MDAILGNNKGQQMWLLEVMLPQPMSLSGIDKKLMPPLHHWMKLSGIKLP